MPNSSIINAMKQANFTEEDIANIKMQRYLQRALPGATTQRVTMVATARRAMGDDVNDNGDSATGNRMGQ